MNLDMSDDVFKCKNYDRIMDFILKRLKDLLNYDKLPSFDKYLKKLRWEIWNKFGNKCFTDFEYLIMDGLRYEEYTLFKKIISIIKKIK